MEIEGQWVHFEIQDAYHPDPREILLGLYGRLFLQGRVLALTESGENGAHYAAIDVEGFKQPVIVPLNKVQLSLTTETDTPE